MDRFAIDANSGQEFRIHVTEAQPGQALANTLVEIDLQTFAESTFTRYTAAIFLDVGRVFLLQADDVIIGTCVCVRGFSRPNEAVILSMGIRPGWRGRGLGQYFLGGVMGYLKDTGLCRLVSLVSKTNRRAVKVYKDVGFSIHESEEDGPESLLRLVFDLQA